MHTTTGSAIARSTTTTRPSCPCPSCAVALERRLDAQHVSQPPAGQGAARCGG
jgi:hypothetical protein